MYQDLDFEVLAQEWHVLRDAVMHAYSREHIIIYQARLLDEAKWLADRGIQRETFVGILKDLELFEGGDDLKHHSYGRAGWRPWIDG